MAVTFDTFQSTNFSGVASTTASIPITFAANANRLAVATLHIIGASTGDIGDTTSIFVSWSDTTSASDSFTELFAGADLASAGFLGVYYLIDPSTAAVTVKFEGNQIDGGAMTAVASVVSFYDVHQVSPFVDSTLGFPSTAASTFSISLAAELDGLCIDIHHHGSTTTVFTPGDTQIAIYNQSFSDLSAVITYKTPASTTETVTEDRTVLPAAPTPYGAYSLDNAVLDVTLTGTMASTDLAGTQSEDITKVLTGAISTITGTQIEAITKILSGAISTITGTQTIAFTKILTGAISSITGAIIVEVFKLRGLIQLIAAPVAGILGITAPATNVSGDPTPTAGIEEEY